MRPEPAKTLAKGSGISAARDLPANGLPDDWGIRPLAELCVTMKAGGTPSRNRPEFWGGEIPFALIEDLTAGGLYLSNATERVTQSGLENSSAWIVPPGSVLLSMYATIGATAVTRIPVATNQAILAIRPGADLDAEFLALQLRHRANELAMQNVQSTQRNVSKTIVAGFPIRLPPFDEQRAIATVLRTVLEAIEACEWVITATRQLKASLLMHLFTYGPVAFEEADRIPLKGTEIGGIPAHWQVGKVGDFATQVQYGLSLRGGQRGSYPILRMNNLQEGRVLTVEVQGGVQYVELEASVLEKFRLVSGDILFNRTNSHELVGKTAVFEDDGNCVFASYLVRVRLDKSRLDPYFANYYLNMASTQARLKRLASRAVSQSNISASKLRSFQVPIPPLEEQRQIAGSLQIIDVQVRAEETRRAVLRALFVSLLQRLMSGSLRLPEFANGS